MDSNILATFWQHITLSTLNFPIFKEPVNKFINNCYKKMEQNLPISKVPICEKNLSILFEIMYEVTSKKLEFNF